MSLLKRFKGIAILFGILFLPLKGWADNRNVLCPVSFENIYIDDFFWYYQFHAQQQNSLPSIWNRLKVQEDIKSGIWRMPICTSCWKRCHILISWNQILCFGKDWIL